MKMYTLGGQVEILPDPVFISGKREKFQRLCFSGPSGKPEDAAGDRELLAHLPENPNTKKVNGHQQNPT